MMKLNAAFTNQHDYDAYLETLTPARQMVSLAKSTFIDLSIVFGLRPQDRAMINADEARLLDYLHEGYQSGEWHPKAGSTTAFGVAMMEGIAGGRPRPEQRDMVIQESVRRCLAMLKAKPGTFVPLANHDPKRSAALDQLDSLEGT